MEKPKFTKINEKFYCDHCGKAVAQAQSTCRDHCPYCLYSKHVDYNPGDRANPCRGLMQPVGYERHAKKGWMINYLCLKCKKSHRNIALLDDEIEADSYEAMLALSSVDKE